MDRSPTPPQGSNPCIELQWGEADGDEKCLGTHIFQRNTRRILKK